eukprot:5498133-Prymnesium_polylepis.1
MCPASTPPTAGTHLKNARACPSGGEHLLLLSPPPNSHVSMKKLNNYRIRAPTRNDPTAAKTRGAREEK